MSMHNARDPYAGRAHADVYNEVAANMAASSVPPEQVHLFNGAAAVSMRFRGGFVTRAVLQAQESGTVTSLLYSGADLTKAKLAATHPMMPVGAYDGLGGQHGPLRWMTFDTYGSGTTVDGPQSVGLMARGGKGLPTVTRHLRLQPHRLDIATWVKAHDVPVETSIGEHLYLSMPEGGPKDVRINGSSVDELIGVGAAAAVARGEAQFWPGYHGPLEVEFPDRKFGLAPAAGCFEEDEPVWNMHRAGMLIWQRPGTPSICIEPTLGYTPDHRPDTELYIGRQATAMISTSLIAL